MVESTRLESGRRETYRGFESPPLRQFSLEGPKRTGADSCRSWPATSRLHRSRVSAQTLLLHAHRQLQCGDTARHADLTDTIAYARGAQGRLLSTTLSGWLLELSDSVKSFINDSCAQKIFRRQIHPSHAGCQTRRIEFCSRHRRGRGGTKTPPSHGRSSSAQPTKRDAQYTLCLIYDFGISFFVFFGPLAASYPPCSSSLRF